jgi:hypothetical protein
VPWLTAGNVTSWHLASGDDVSHPNVKVWVDPDESGESVVSVPARLLRAWGFEVWDGASADVRNSYPVSPQELRVVQYESCRGLEGWITFLWGLDEFFEYKLNSWRPAGAPGPDDARQASL